MQATYISAHDKNRVIEQIGQARSRWSTYAPFLDWFRSELDGAHALSPADVPEDVITMNSRFELFDLRRNQVRRHILVYPDDTVVEDGVSILTPMGMALLGARVGDIVRWVSDDDFHACKIVRLTYQPEAAGRLDL